MICVEVTFTVAPTDQNIAVQALLEEVPDMQALPGNLGSKVLTDPRAEGAITLLHQWDSVENLDAYRNGPLMAKIGACLRPLMTGAPTTNVYEAHALRLPAVMTDLPAFCVYRDFPPEDDKTVQFDRHYLLYAAKGTMRLEADGRSWTLPPARAALIAAGAPITLSIATTITCCSALFAPQHYDAPDALLRVLDMSPLARELILACRSYGPEAEMLPPDGRQLFDTLHMLVTRAAAAPNDMWMPVGTSDVVRKAQALTEEGIEDTLNFKDIAAAVCLTERTLARRFQEEIGMPWRDFLRRLRMIRAVEALSDPSRQVTQVALDVGYRSSSAFNAAFLAFTGQTPSMFRASIPQARAPSSGPH